MGNMQLVMEAVTEMNEKLIANGWHRVNPFELSTEDQKLWFGTSFVTGEYTVHASHREKGYGVARGNIRVRVTPALIQHHPDLGGQLVKDLLDAQEVMDAEGFEALVWPPPVWSELSMQGVVDFR